MKHQIACLECKQWREIELAGDLGQYSGGTIGCQCPEDVALVPCRINGQWAMVHIADMDACPRAVGRFKKMEGDRTNG